MTAVNGTAIAEGETLAVGNGSVKLVSTNLEYTGDDGLRRQRQLYVHDRELRRQDSDGDGVCDM